MKYYITFGQIHAHRINGKTFDKNSIAMIEADGEGAARELAFQLFGREWHRLIPEDHFDAEKIMPFFPRGIIEV